MLLSLMRKHAKSWLIKFLIGMIAVVFIFYFGYSFRAQHGVKVAYVNGELITRKEHQKAYNEIVEGLRAQYKDLLNEDLIKSLNLRNRALQSLINEKLVSQEARRLGLSVSDDEIQKAIMSYAPFQVEGRFHMGRYQGILSRHQMKPEDFEADMARELLDTKLRQFLFAFMEVTDAELLDHYTFANEKITLSYLQFKPELFKDAIKPDAEALSAFFKANREAYRIPEKIKLTYLELDPALYREKVKLTEAEIVGYYEYHVEAFAEPDQVKARHILLKVPEEATEDEERAVRNRAKAILEEARGGKDFAALAEKYSEGPTRSKGGDLGYFSRGDMVKEFEEAAFGLIKGEISDLVRTGFGYHIIQVEDVKAAGTKPLEAVRDQVVEALLSNRSAEMAHERGLSLMDQMPYDVDLAGFVSQEGLATRETGYFAQSEPVPGIGGDEILRQSLFALEGGETSELMELNGKFYIFQVADRKKSRLPEQAEVSEAVREAYVASAAGRQAREAAEAFLDALKGGRPWDESAKEEGLSPEETGFFSRRDPIPKIGGARGWQEALFGLSRAKPYPDEVFESEAGVFVFRWEGYEGIDEAEYRSEKERYRFSLMQLKQQQAYQKWLENLRARADIEIVSPEEDAG
jgi:peptidyl-prolyl cis-trans isomerase D